MQVKKLIEQLQQYPPEMPVVIAGYEDGYNDVSIIQECALIVDAHTQGWGGQHEATNAENKSAVRAVRLGGLNTLANDGEKYVR